LKDVVASFASLPEFKQRMRLDLEESKHELVDLGSFRMFVSTRDQAVGNVIYTRRSYEPHVARALADRLSPGMTFVDVGANIGYFSMLAAHAVGRDGQVFAFEPSPYNVKLLYLNARTNGYDNVHIFPFALSNREGFLSYQCLYSNGSTFPPPEELALLFSAPLVYATTLDRVLADVARVDVLKADIEGAEYLALSGGESLLKKHRPVIVSEFSPNGLRGNSQVTPEAYLNLLLLDQQYELSIIHPSNRLVPCGRDVGRILECYRQEGTEHIDIMASPSGR